MAEVNSFVKGLEILRQLAPEPEGKTAIEIGALLDIPRTTAIRFLDTLCRHNYAVKRGPAYYLGPAALSISMNYIQKSDLVRAASAACAMAAKDLKLPVSFFVGGKDAVTMIARESEVVTGNLYGLALGSQLNLAHSAAGIAALMGQEIPAADIEVQFALKGLTQRIETARQLGYAISHDEVTPGYTAIAVPVHSPVRQLTGAFHAVFLRPSSTETSPKGGLPILSIVAALLRARDAFLGL